MNIATAGHVDHGKTSLVKALTQIDTDRLAEEQRRGMSIDLGFAYADFGAGPLVGFVDVPGHERFVRNMLAGVACIDLALLVIAADDGPMPQTREHLAILELLGVPRAVVALTKVDRVGADRLAGVQREVAEMLATGPYAGAALFPLVATDADSTRPLHAHLREACRRLPQRAFEGQFRLAVDRSFTLAGAGRVVTGAVLSGAVRVGDTVAVAPRGGTARVRGLHAQNRPATSARAGQRCALNLAGSDLRHAAPARGDWIVATPAPTQRLDVRLRVLAAQPRPLGERATPLRLHIGAAEVGARLALLGPRSIAPGGDGVAQLLLDAPIDARCGDRFVVRDAAAQRTIGGGQVLDPFGAVRGRARPPRLAQLAAGALPAPAAALVALLRHSDGAVDGARFALARNLSADEFDALLQALAGQIHVVAGSDGQRHVLDVAHWRSLRERVVGALAAWHAAQPEHLGPDTAALARRLQPRVAPAGVLRALLDALIEDGVVRREGMRVCLAGHRARLSDEDSALLQRIAGLLRQAGLRAPIVGDVAAALALPLPPLLQFLERSSRLGQLARIAPNRFYLPQTVAELLAVARQLADASADGGFDTAAFRDRSGIGRNLSVQVLEFMDREGLTRFDGERRRLAG